MLDPLEGLPVIQIGVSVGKQLVISIWQKKLMSEFFLFQVLRLETLVPKNHFVREVAPFPRSGHIYILFISVFINLFIYQEPTDIPSRKKLMGWVCARGWCVRRGSLL